MQLRPAKSPDNSFTFGNICASSIGPPTSVLQQASSNIGHAQLWHSQREISHGERLETDIRCRRNHPSGPPLPTAVSSSQSCAPRRYFLRTRRNRCQEQAENNWEITIWSSSWITCPRSCAPAWRSRYLVSKTGAYSVCVTTINVASSSILHHHLRNNTNMARFCGWYLGTFHQQHEHLGIHLGTFHVPLRRLGRILICTLRMLIPSTSSSIFHHQATTMVRLFGSHLGTFLVRKTLRHLGRILTCAPRIPQALIIKLLRKTPPPTATPTTITTTWAVCRAAFGVR
jgi:hypothetical protein